MNDVMVRSYGALWKVDVPTRFGSYDDVEQLCGIIMRGNETLKKMDCVKADDQQWNGVVPDSFDVRTASPQRVTSGTRAPAIRAGHSAAPRFSMTGTAPLQVTPR